MWKLCTGDNSNIIQVYAHGPIKDSGCYYIDMELCDFNLKQFMERFSFSSSEPITMPEVWNIILQVTNGLVFIHAQREVHRDLKPSNSMSVLV